MNLANLLDDVIKGTVVFLLSFLETTVILLRHPLMGSKLIYCRSLYDEKNQISSKSYLALCVLVMAYCISELDFSKDESSWIGVARLVINGRTSDFIPMVAGSIVGTMLIGLGLLVLSTLVASKRKNELISRLEYHLGLITLITGMFLTAFHVEDRFRFAGIGPATWLTIFVLLGYSYSMYIAGFSIVTRWSGLIRMQRAYLYYLPRYVRASREGKLKIDNLIAAVIGPIKEYRSQQKGLQRVDNFRGFAVITITIIPLGMGLIGVMFAGWVAKMHDPELSVVNASCDLQKNPPDARVYVWNSSSMPQVRWSGRLRVYVPPKVVEVSDSRQIIYPGRTFAVDARPASGQDSDFLAPNNAIEMIGPMTQISVDDVRDYFRGAQMRSISGRECEGSLSEF